jgi:threonine dehydratase
MLKVTVQDIEKAQKVLKGVIRETELRQSLSASRLLGVETFIKFENSQYTGSFKFRGAYHKILTLTDEEKKRGVIASSAGNHAQGVARSAQLLGVKATIIMPHGAPLVKVEATRQYGAQVIFHGEVVDEAIVYAQELVAKEGLTFIHPYEDKKIIEGQGTLGLEIYTMLPQLDSILVPIGGGGLISGVAVAIKALKPSCRIIGVVSDKASGMMQLKSGEKYQLSVKPGKTIADGIAIKKPSKLMYDSFIDPLVDEVVSVTDDEIADGIVFLMERAKTLAEGSGAVAMAAALKGNLNLGATTCVVVSGGNIDLNIISKVIERAQVRKGRLAEILVSVSDLPGSLSQITQLIAQAGANVIDVHHDRLAEGLSLRQTRIHFILEARDFDHIHDIKKRLTHSGFLVL